MAGVKTGRTPTSSTRGAVKAQPTHRIARGDTLSGIARRYGVSLQSLLRANPQIKDPDRIFAGQTLTLPDTAQDTGAATSTSRSSPANTAAEIFSRDQVKHRSGGEDYKLAARDATPASDARVDDDKALGLTGLLVANRKRRSGQVETTKVSPEQQAATLKAQIKANSDPVKTTRGAAKKLHDAMAGWGTNEAEIFRTLGDRSTAELDQIRKDYQTSYKTSLDSALAQELSGADLSRAKLLLKGNDKPLPKRDARLLQVAMDGVGTSNKLVLDTLHGKTDAERKAIAKAYHKQTGRALEDDIRGEHSGRDEVFALATLKRGTITDADRLRAAMTGVGTDERAVFQVLEGKSAKQIDKLRSDFQDFYGRDLETDLQSELSGDDAVRAKALMEDGQLSRADKLKIAMEGMGTDERAIEEALREATPAERQALKKEYAQKYGDLIGDLTSELGEPRLSEMRTLLDKGKLEPEQQLNRAIRGFGTDEARIFEVLDGKSPEQLKQIKANYQKRYGESLENHLRGEMTGVEQDKALALLSQGDLSLKERIYYAGAGLGTDTKALFAALEKASPEERGRLASDFKKTYGTALQTFLHRELSGRDQLKADLLLKHGTLNARQQAEVALTGVGTRESDLFKALEGASPSERRAMRQDSQFMKSLADELGATDYEHADLLLKNGTLTREQKLSFAMQGVGTDEKAIHEALADLSPAERRQVQQNYQAQYGRPLLDDLKAELGKRDLWKVEDALAQPPETLRERIDRAESHAARERASGSPIGTASDALMNVISQNGFEIEQDLREYKQLTREAAQQPDKAQNLASEVSAAEKRIDLHTAAYLVEKEAVADTASSVATMAVAAAATAATGGLAAPAAMALVAASAGVTKVATHQLVVGDSYDLAGADGAQDLTTGAVDGLSMYAMGKAGEHLTAAIGKRVLAAQGGNVSEKGLMLFGRQALRESGKEVTRRGLERATHQALVKVGADFVRSSVVKRVGINAVIGGVKGAVYSAPRAGARSAFAASDAGLEFGDAVRQVLSDSGQAAVEGAKGWAVGTAAYQVGAITSEAAMSYIKLQVGTRLAAGQSFDNKRMLKAGYEALGDGAKAVDKATVLKAGRQKLLIDMAQSKIDRSTLGRLVDIGVKEVITRGTAVQPRSIFNSLGDHGTWEYGMDGAFETLFMQSSSAAMRESAAFGAANMTAELAKNMGGRGSSSAKAGLANLVWRSIASTWR